MLLLPAIGNADLYHLKEPTAPESQPPISASAEPATGPDPKSQIKEYDTLGAHIEMTDQHNRIRESDIQYRKFLRQRPHPIKPSSGTFAGHDEASFLDPTLSPPADTEATVHEAHAQQGNADSSLPTGDRTEYNPQAQEWDPHGHDEVNSGHQGGGTEGGQGQSFDPEVEPFRPFGEQDGQAGDVNEH